MRRALAALGCLATIGAADYVLHRRKPRWILVGLFDHPAHVATAGLLALHGAASGMAAHYARDLGVGSGVPLLWPATTRSVRVPYAVYAAACIALAGRAFTKVVRSGHA
jgi:hypothetical protein